MHPLLFHVLTFVPLSMAVAVALAASSVLDVRDLPRRALRVWLLIAVFGLLLAALVVVAQDPRMIMG